MIASVIGKTLLQEYNRREGKSYSAEEFFDNVFYPIFYDHPRYLQWMKDTPFVTNFKKGKLPDEANRSDRLQTFREKIKSPEFPDYTYAIGFPSMNSTATTSGQVTNLSPSIPREEIYATWIGNGLGIRVQGGICFLFNHPQILWTIYTGWQIYRSFIEEYEDLRPNQIDTWNGQWFSYACSEEFDELSPSTGMSGKMSNANGGGLEFTTQQWTEVLFAVADQFNEEQITGYVYSLGQTNTTVGFIPFKLPDISLPLQFYKELFGDNETLTGIKNIRKLYGTARSFKVACQKGVIGTAALEPKDLAQYMNSTRGKMKIPDYKKADQDTAITFNVYQTWLLAMLNNKELWERANDAAEAYLEYVAGSKNVSRGRINLVNEVLEATNKRKFIESNITVVESAGASAQKISDLVQDVNLMPEDSFRYFHTLIKFRYAFWKNQQQGEN
jgi:hypothetical protein